MRAHPPLSFATASPVSTVVGLFWPHLIGTRTYVVDGYTYVRYHDRVTITELRRDIYTVFDRISRGEGSVRIERNGKVIVIQREESLSRLARLQEPPTKAYNGDSDEVIGMSWESEWNRLPT